MRTTMYYLISIAAIFTVMLVSSCGSTSEESVDGSLDLSEELTDNKWFTFDETHQTWSTASRVISDLMAGAKFDDLGMMPIGENSVNDFSSKFPEQLGPYQQTPYDPQMADKEQFAWLRLYEKGDEKLLFTVYRFDSPLNMMNFFVTLDSMYREQPELTVDEIQLGNKSGWSVTDAQGHSREVGILLDDNTFLQVDVCPEFTGDVLELVRMIDF